jgi:hypothetical protein
MQGQAWLASVPSQQQLDEVLGNDPAAALVGRAKSRAPIEPGFIGYPGDDPEFQKEFAIAQAAAAAFKKNRDAMLAAEHIRALHAFVHLLARAATTDSAIPPIVNSR